MVEVDAARGDNDEIRMQVARLAAARARTALEKLQRDMERMTLRAPFDGIVLGAQNLSARIGQVPRPGEGVLEVIDPSAWKVQIDVREQDLRILDRTVRKNGPVEGSVRLAANPTQSYPLEVTSSEQLAYGLDTTHGEFLFQISAPLKVEPSQLDLLKSGFAGRASFDCGRRPIVYVLFHDFINFLRLRFS